MKQEIKLYTIKRSLFFVATDVIMEEDIPENKIENKLKQYKPADIYESFYSELQKINKK